MPGTDIAVSALGVGVSFVAAEGQEVVTRGVRAAIEAGINLFDTAPYYSDGRDEEMLGRALKGARDKVILNTKVGYSADPAHHRSVDGLMAQLDGSLRRLATDHVDIVQVHEADFRRWWTADVISAAEGVNPRAPLIEDGDDYDFAGAPVVAFLDKARRSGKARHVGITAKDARRAARLVPSLPFDTVMIAHQLNPILRNASAFLLPETTAKRVGVFVAAPLMQGMLARPKRHWRDAPPPWMDDTFSKAYFGFIDLADRLGIDVPELAIRWLLGESRIHSVVFGFRSADDIAANVAAAERGPLPTQIKAEVDAIGIVHPLIFQGRTSL